MVMGGDSCVSWSWIRIPAPFSGWTFLSIIRCKNCNVCLKRPKINKKEAAVGPFFFKKNDGRNLDSPIGKYKNYCDVINVNITFSVYLATLHSSILIACFCIAF